MNPQPKKAHTVSPAFWVEEYVNSWIIARIKNQPWVQPVVPANPTLIRKPEVMRRTGMSNVFLWHMEKDGKFPKRLHIGEGDEVIVDVEDLAEAAE
jgi:hypothetical protein